MSEQLVRGGKTRHDPIGDYFRPRVCHEVTGDAVLRSAEIWQKVLTLVCKYPDLDHRYVLDSIVTPRQNYQYDESMPPVELWLDCVSIDDQPTNPFALDHVVTLFARSHATESAVNEVYFYEFHDDAIYRFIDYSNEPDERVLVTSSAELNYISILVSDLTKVYQS